MMRTDVSATQLLGRFVAALELDALPPVTIDAVRRHTLDTLGAALAGAKQPETVAARRAATMLYGIGSGVVWADAGEGTSPAGCAFINGVAAHALELDDASGCDHSGAVVIPAVFAALACEAAIPAGPTPSDNLGAPTGMGKRGDTIPCATDGDVVAAIVAGYDIGRRVLEAAGGYDAHNNAGWHSTGTCGVFGATAAVARVLRCDPDTITSALGIAGSFAAGTWAFAEEGAMTKRLHPGNAAAAGLMAVALARSGMRGPRTLFEADWGGFLSTYAGSNAEPGLLTVGLGEQWRIHRSSIKPFASCRGTHAAIEAVIVFAHAGLTVENVERVIVQVTPTVARMCGAVCVDTLVDAQLSLRYALALAIQHRAVNIDHFSSKHRTDPVMHELMRKIDVMPCDFLTSNVAAHVVAVTTSGGQFEQRVEVPEGSPGRMLSDDALRAKYDSLAARSLARPSADRLAERILRLGQSPRRMAADIPALLRAEPVLVSEQGTGQCGVIGVECPFID